jgi:hypothetical protein
VGRAGFFPHRQLKRLISSLLPQAKKFNFSAAKRSPSRKLQFEPLEPRLLLSADLAFMADPGGSDLTLRLDDIDGIETLVIIDNEIVDPLAQVVASQALADTSAVRITGGAGDDRLTVDFNPFIVPVRFDDTTAGDNDFLALTGAMGQNWQLSDADAGQVGNIGFSGVEHLVGGSGSDTLVGTDTGSAWNITAPDAGSVNGISFSGIENLLGGNSDDSFQFDGGSVSSVSGGGGNDTLDLSTDTAGVTVNLHTGTTDHAGSISSIESLLTGSGDDSVIGALNPVSIDTGSGSDTLDYSVQTLSLTLDLSSGDLLGIESIVGGGGDDTLLGTTADATWNITGTDSDDVAGISFSSFENLTGQADNEDTFIVSTNGSLSGLMDGGDGGFDSMVLDGGSFNSVEYTAFDAHSGLIDRDGVVLNYAGLEPITDTSTVADRVISTSSLDDRATLTDNGSTMTLAPVSPFFTFESVTFNDPTNSLTINLGGDSGIPFISQDVLTINSFDAPGVDLIMNGQGGLDVVNIAGSVTADAVTINAETINVSGTVNVTDDVMLNAVSAPATPPIPLPLANSAAAITVSGTIAATNITLIADATLGSLVTPDNSPVANVSATINVTGNLSGQDITLMASGDLVSSVTNPPLPGVPLASLLGSVTTDTAVAGSATITATGAFSAIADSHLDATVLALSVAGAPTSEVAIATPIVVNTATSHLSGDAIVSAAGSVQLQALTDTVVSATADGNAGANVVGTTIASPVVFATSEAYVDESAGISQSASIDIDAEATGILTTTAISTPSGAAGAVPTLASIGAMTSSGPQLSAAALAFTTLTSTTRAFVNTDDTLVSSGAVSLLASSSHDMHTTADGTYTNSAVNNGFAVALNATFLRDEAFVGGTPTVNAPTLNIATGGGSTLIALARSGEAGLGGANPQTEAASLVLSTGFNLSHAYIDVGTILTLIGNTNVNITASNTTAIDLSAEPQGAVIPADLGLGRSVALNTSGYTTQASILAGASIIGAGNLTLFADGDQSSLVTAYAGTLADNFGPVEDLNQITVAGSISINTTAALIEAGATLALSGALNVQSNHHASNLLRARSDAAAVVGEVPGRWFRQ